MPRLRLVLEYDGTDFVGWQTQRNGRSVHDVVSAALRTLLKEEVKLEAAGRTDAGVHALGQVAAFTTSRTLPDKAYLRGLNGLLPDDVAVISVEEVDPGFDPRRWALGKHYRYRLSNRPQRSPLLRRTHWQVFTPLSVDAMVAASRALLGEHDFSAFRAADCQAKTPVRHLTRLDVVPEPGGTLSFEVEGTAFLKHMVRNLVGTLVEVGRGKEPARWVKEVLESKDRTRAGPTAPAQGLCLVEVRYGSGPRKAQP